MYTEKKLLKFNNFFYKHDLITPKISLCYFITIRIKIDVDYLLQLY
jgi:hypothetical protein